MLLLIIYFFVCSKERATLSLLAEPGYSLDTVYFLVGGKTAAGDNATPKFSFKTCTLKMLSVIVVSVIPVTIAVASSPVKVVN